MGLFDFFGGGTPAEKAQKLKAKLTQKYGEAQNRQKAIDDLLKLNSPDVVPVLMLRFPVNVDPQTTDRAEKDQVFEAICALKEAAIPHVVDYLRKADQASSWAVKIIDTVLPADKAIGLIVDELTRLGAEYTRDPEKKEVLLHYLAEKSDPRIGPAVIPFLNDMSDDVKMAAIKTVAIAKEPTSRDVLINLLVADETAKRVQTACIQALHDTGFDAQGFREKIEPKLSEPWFLDKHGVMKKRG